LQAHPVATDQVRVEVARVLTSSTSSTSTPTLPTVVSGNTTAIRHQRPIGGAAVGIVEQQAVSCSGTTMAASMTPPAIHPRAWATSVADLRSNARRRGPGPRGRCSASRSSAQCLSSVARPDSPGAAGRSAGPLFRDRNGHEADDPSPKIGRQRAGRPCDRETIPTPFVESVVNQVIGEQFLHDPHRAAVVGDHCGESRGAAGVVVGSRSRSGSPIPLIIPSRPRDPPTGHALVFPSTTTRS